MARERKREEEMRWRRKEGLFERGMEKAREVGRK
jgi:hypothetical protein